ncbi:MAG: hypothetical protein M1462_00310 [Candidatus Thermoplasmatota archaeon]|jgi:hypothetical protein|nr:hypothetical protein [Candidatus Thermoplasmatota archaeon]
MKKKVIFMVVIAILIILTASIMVSVVESVSQGMEHEKTSPAASGSSFVYSFASSINYKSFQNNNSTYYNETLKLGDNYINGHMYVNITTSLAHFQSYLCNSTGSVIANKTFSEPLNGTMFKSLFPAGNHINTGSILVFGNNLIAIKGMYTECSASQYTINYGHRKIEYVPYVGKVESVHNPFTEYNSSIFFSASFIQSKNYAMLGSVSIPGNSTIAARVLDNIGIQTSYFTMKLVKTNVGITAINYSAYLEKYTILYALIWIIGIGYLLSPKNKKRK